MQINAVLEIEFKICKKKNTKSISLKNFFFYMPIYNKHVASFKDRLG